MTELLESHDHVAPQRGPNTRDEVHISRPFQGKTRPRAALLAALLVLGTTGCDREPRPPENRTGSTAARAAATPALLDDYSDARRNRHGAERLLIDDRAAGSQSRAVVKCEEGVLSVHGDLVPGRGVPAFISAVSPLSTDGGSKDLTGHEGVRLHVKLIKGALCVQVATSTITNFDYHTSAPIISQGSGFQEIRIPFHSLKRAWSEQVDLNLKSVTSVNLVSFGLSPGAFAYAVDEIGFY